MKSKVVIGIVLLCSIFLFCLPEIKSKTSQEVETKFRDPLWRGESACIYDLVKDEMSIGLASFEISSGKLKNEKVYLIEGKIVMGGVSDISKITIRAKDLKPMKTEKNMLLPQGETKIEAEYFGNKVKLTAKTSQAPPQRMRLSLPEDAYDNEEILMLLRTLPFKVGLQMEFSNFSPAAGCTYPSVVRVLTEESVQTPAGTFECFKVELKVAMANITHYAWYTKDYPHYLVKYDNREIVFKLKEVLQDGEKVEF
ncbi:MAG: hypothetical protein DRP84_10600 [Spirochaetes bacterium]|nr:MAG: hypothetical protein DRP84_10600 [Spirochaetota bacterium]